MQAVNFTIMRALKQRGGLVVGNVSISGPGPHQTKAHRLIIRIGINMNRTMRLATSSASRQRGVDAGLTRHANVTINSYAKLTREHSTLMETLIGFRCIARSHWCFQ